MIYLPTIEQIVVGSELIIILYPVRIIVRRMADEARKERNRIIRHHVKTGHKSRFKTCIEGECVSLQTPMNQPLRVQLEALPELDSEL